MAPMTTQRRTELVFVIFFFSGLAGLIYESVWSHYVKLFLGHAAYAQTLVLVVYIGGLALGSWLCARWTSSIRFAKAAASPMAGRRPSIALYARWVSPAGSSRITLRSATCSSPAL